MRLSSEKFLELGEILPTAYWKNYFICVGETAVTIAQALNLDFEKSKILGYIHDIGKS